MNPYIINIPARRFQNQDGVPTPDPLELTNEISWSETDLYHSYVAYGQNPDKIVQHKGLQIYREMMDDDQVKACIELRKQARLSTPWQINSAKKGNFQADMFADFITHVFQRMRGTMEDNLYGMFSAHDYGFSLSELVYEILEDGPFSGKIGLRAIKTREPFNYDFKIDPHGNLLGIVYTGAAPFDAEKQNQQRVNGGKVSPILGTLENPFPPDKFVIYSYNAKFGNWYGESDLKAAFRPWFAKKHVLKFWNIWLERYASPFLWITYKGDKPIKKETMDRVDNFIRNLSARNSMRVPDSFTMTPIQFSTAGGDSYEKAVEAQNRFIAHAILTPNLLGYTQQPATGSYALGKKHFDAFLWVLRKMGRDAEESLVGEQVIRRLIDLNFPNANLDLMPSFKFEGLEEEDIEARSRIVSMLAGGGFLNPHESWIRDYLNLPDIENVMDIDEDSFIPLPRNVNAEIEDDEDEIGIPENNEIEDEEIKDEQTEDKENSAEKEMKFFAEDDLVDGPGGKAGIWRTIRGRKIFIPVGEGESIGDAIKKRFEGDKRSEAPNIEGIKVSKNNKKAAKIKDDEIPKTKGAGKGEVLDKHIKDLASKIHEGKMTPKQLEKEFKGNEKALKTIRTIRSYIASDFSEIREISGAIASGKESEILAVRKSLSVSWDKYGEGTAEINKILENASITDKALYRGTNKKKGVNLKVGDTFDTKGISSFTSNSEMATSFFDDDSGGKVGKAVVYRIKRGRSFRISSLGFAGKFVEDQQESIVMGKYKVTSHFKDHEQFGKKFDVYDLEEI